MPHITLRAIANNAEIDVIWEEYQEKLEPLRQELNAALGTSTGRSGRSRARPSEVLAGGGEGLHDGTGGSSASPASRRSTPRSPPRADYEYLYDKPYEDRSKVRVAGPFTVESISPHRVLAVDENDEFIDTFGETRNGYGTGYDFAQIILENLRRPACSRPTRRTASPSPR